MQRKSKNRFTIKGDKINIDSDSWSKSVQTTYREDYFSEISSHNWSLNRNYPYNSILGYLHIYIMKKWYGDAVYSDFKTRGYVVDHLNNNHCDATISNLEFLKKDYNTAKGQKFDKDSRRLMKRLALSIFKDFSTSLYQITIACNDTIVGTDASGNKHLINDIKLLYDCDYSIVINDAENILLIYETRGKISTRQTHACDVKIIESPNIELTEEEKQAAVISRDGVLYLVLGNGKAYVNSAYYEQGWTPDDKK